MENFKYEEMFVKNEQTNKQKQWNSLPLLRNKYLFTCKSDHTSL